MIFRKVWLAALLFFAACVTHAPAQAQLSETLGGLSDENLKGYLKPLNTGLGGTMNAAIFRTGYVPKSSIEFSFSLVAAAIGFGTDDKSYLPTDPDGFTSISPTEVPTVVGDPKGMTVEGVGGPSQIYPGGFDLDGFEIAVPQLSIGTFMGTRALIRYIAFDLGDSELGNLSYFGIGAQHSISQWFPALPVDLAAGFLVQTFKIGDELVNAHATQVMVTASKGYRYFQPYVGLGVDTIRLDAKHEDEEDPEASIDVSLDRQTDPHLTLGVVGKVPYFSIFAEYNVSAVTGIAVGLNIGR
jgi:hypothetical protein